MSGQYAPRTPVGRDPEMAPQAAHAAQADAACPQPGHATRLRQWMVPLAGAGPLSSARSRLADGWRALRNSVEMCDGHASAEAILLLARAMVRRGRHHAADRVRSGPEKRLPFQSQMAIARVRLLEWSPGGVRGARRLVTQTLAVLPEQSPYRTGLEMAAPALVWQARPSD